METFVVRVFVAADAEEAGLAGLVEQVGSGWSARFANDEELLASIRAWLDRKPTRPPTASGEKPRS